VSGVLSGTDKIAAKESDMGGIPSEKRGLIKKEVDYAVSE
jgi:hypothetical protein